MVLIANIAPRAIPTSAALQAARSTVVGRLEMPRLVRRGPRPEIKGFGVAVRNMVRDRIHWCGPADGYVVLRALRARLWVGS